MATELNLILSPSQASSADAIKRAVFSKLKGQSSQFNDFRIIRKSIDARGGKVRINLGVMVYGKNESIVDEFPSFNYKPVNAAPEVIIVGSGPAGLFAALRLIELGLKPIIFERGQDISNRKRDIALLNRNVVTNFESNYAFGEGGAGTFSDGKLFTRSRKRGDINRILRIFHQHGAQDEILFESHPHIGSNVLPRVIMAMRKTIEHFGGIFNFSSRVDSLIVKNGKAIGVQLSSGISHTAGAVVLATGHSARDIYSMLINQNIALETKPFAMGVRVEHPQALIDSIQYHGIDRGDFLPAATYKLVQQVEGRGVYSFCMCPGGYIVPALTGEGQVVVNGMSPSFRNSKWANSGIVVEVKLSDIEEFSLHGPLAGLEFQKHIEGLAYANSNGVGVVAPAQRLSDFVKGVTSNALPSSSYNPGLVSSPLHEWLPNWITRSLQQGFAHFDKKMRGFITSEALIVGVESRTSAPVRIPRNPDTLEHIGVKGLFPSGEGSGYAGGIMSSAIDGERSAEAVAQYLKGG
ncbi:MAG: FAD-binding protein [Tenuifilaceae bacterium]|nr:FAD-binding protein [Tenuifilaceae bacterium]